MLWIVVTVLIFGGVFIILDYLKADDDVRILSLLLLMTIALINAVWRAAGMLAARIELMLMSTRDHDEPHN